jgi:hypothetical protein
MRPRRPILRFLLVFAPLYAVLIAPWPGWAGAYGGFFRALNRAVFAREEGRLVVRIGAAPSGRALDTEITIVDAARADAAGRAPARILQIDSRGVGWVPTALLAALIAASPVPPGRRMRAMLAGLALIHAYILVSVGEYIWNESASLGLFALPPFWKAVADGLEETLVTQLGASFVAPAILWLVVTFRIREFGEFWGGNSVADP